LLTADWRTLLFLCGEVVIPAVLILALVGRASLGKNSAEHARTLLGALAVSAAVIGSANAIREIVKEWPIYLRERSVGVSRSAYLVSKLVSIGSITAVQAALLTFIATRGADGPTTSVVLGKPLVELCLDIVLAGIAAVALGLLVSALVSSSEKAMALIPVIFIVQWLFSGVAVDLKGPVVGPLSYAASARWGMAAEASSTDLCRFQSSANERSTPGRGAPEHQPCDSLWRSQSGVWGTSVAALAFLTLLTMIGSWAALNRRETISMRGG
jgi:ABC-type transport system involved in multi-copper enzyme maturation permease subunit